MKKIILFALIVIGLGAFKNSRDEKSEYIILSGHIKSASGGLQIRSTSLFKFEKDVPKDVNGFFNDTLKIKNGYYFLSGFGHGGISLYVKKGSKIVMNVDFSKQDKIPVFTGDLSAENNYLQARSALNNRLFSYLYGSSEEDRKLLKSLSENERLAKIKNATMQIENLWNKHIKAELMFDPKFVKFEKVKNKVMIANYIDDLGYQLKVKDSAHTFSDEFKSLKIKYSLTINNEEAYYNLAIYRRYLEDFFYSQMRQVALKSSPEQARVERIKMINDQIKSNVIKENMLFNAASGSIKSVTIKAILDSLHNVYQLTASDQENIRIVDSLYKNALKTMPGMPAPEFSYESVDEKRVSLSDFKGKYVYIDLWATWCGPCIYEIPFLEKIEKKYHSNNNIVFISISIDAEVDRDKWKKMINEKNMQGIQLIADEGSRVLMKHYQVAGIPRFILIDPNGNTVTPNAPRPSEDALMTLFNKLEI